MVSFISFDKAGDKGIDKATNQGGDKATYIALVILGFDLRNPAW